MPNVFDRFVDQTTKHKIKELGGAEITLRQITLKESQDLANELIKGVDKDGNPVINYEAANLTQIKKISLALVDPKMSLVDLENLSIEARAALDEIFALVDPHTAKAIDEAKKAKGKPNSKK